MPRHFSAQSLPTLSRLAAAALALALGAGAAGVAHAQAAPDLGQITQQWLDDALQRNDTPGPLRMEVSVGTLDERLRLAPCARIEPYLPAGAKLWGRTRLGLRCLEGATRWNVFLPITVKAFGPAWVLAGNVASGAVLTEADAMASEVDWAAEPAAVVADPALWVGQVATRNLMAGHALRQSMVRAPHLFKNGTQVRVLAQGPGYAVSASGQAMGAGAVGQSVRVRMGNGKIISGLVNEDGTVTGTL